MLLVLVVYAIVNLHWVATPDLYHGEIIYEFTTPTAYRSYCRTRYTKILSLATSIGMVLLCVDVVH